MKSLSRFYTSLGLLILLNAVIKPVWIFGIDRQVQNTVGTTEYGVYFSLFNLSVVFSFLLDWGFTNYFNRQLASREKGFGNHLGNFLLYKFQFLLLYVLIVFLIAAFSNVRHWNILIAVVLIQALQSFFLFFRSVITAHQWFRTDAWLSVLDKSLMILLCGGLLYIPSVFGSISIEIFLIIQISCTFLATIIAWLIVTANGISFKIGRAAFSPKRIFREVFPFAMIILLMSVHYRLDGFLLSRLHHDGAHEAGVYALSYRLLDATNMIGVLIAMFLLPYIARQWSKSQNFNGVVLVSRHFLILFSIAIATVSFFLAPWILKILYPQSSQEAIHVLQWCIPALIGYSLVQIYGTVMTATGHIVAFCDITFVAVVINSALNFLWIPTMGALGSCYAALASQGFCGIAVLVFVWKKSLVPIHVRSVIIYIFTAVGLSGFLYWGRSSKADPLLLITGVALISLIALFSLGLKMGRRLIFSFVKQR